MKTQVLLASVCLLLGACSKPAAPLAVATPETLKAHSAEFKKEVLTPAPGVHVAIGYGIANSILIEGDDGALLVDTTESLEAGREVAAAFAKLTSKPVKAIIYTHSHPDHVQGAAAFIPAGATVPIYAQEDVAANMDKIASELQPVITRRSLRMYGYGLSPDELLNVGIGPNVDIHEGTTLGILRPTKTFRDTLDDTVAGIRFTLVHAPGETEDQIFVWLPDRKILLPGDNIYRAFPNLYTIRGTGYRDPKRWAASLDKMRHLGAELVVPSHTRPISGKAEGARPALEVLARDVLAAMTYKPADIIHVNAGRLKIGAPADLTLIDLAREWTVDPKQFSSKSQQASNSRRASPLGTASKREWPATTCKRTK